MTYEDGKHYVIYISQKTNIKKARTSYKNISE